MTSEIPDMSATESHFCECKGCLGDTLEDDAAIVVQGGTNSAYVIPETSSTTHLSAERATEHEILA